MALHLKRITWPYEAMKCNVTKKLLSYGDYYYEDDVDGLIVDAEYYHKRKHNEKIQEAMYENRHAFDELSYRKMMLEAERNFLETTLMDRILAKPDTGEGDK
jgi:hypothetical protein